VAVRAAHGTLVGRDQALDELYEVDHSTVDLISALARRQAPAKLMLLATCRPFDLEPRNHPLKALAQDLLVHRLGREIAPAPLTEAEVAEYLAARSHAEVSRATILRLANSLPAEEPLRQIFLAAPAVARILNRGS
jgi:hypothetical protein